MMSEFAPSAGASQHVATRIARLTVEAEGIVVVRFTAGARLDGSSVAEVVAAHVELAAGRKYPTLADLRGVVSDNRAARQLGSGTGPASVISKLALLVGSPLSRVVGNFFIHVSRPPFPTQLFTREDSARHWLLSTRV